MRINDVTEQVSAGAIDAHRQLGPGLLDSTYEARLVFELADRVASR